MILRTANIHHYSTTIPGFPGAMATISQYHNGKIERLIATYKVVWRTS